MITKKPVGKLSDSVLSLYPIKDIIRGWHFCVDEISAGYYRVTGIDEWGRTVSRDGIDPEELLITCKKDIIEIEGRK
jgi:hypothetical protein